MKEEIKKEEEISEYQELKDENIDNHLELLAEKIRLLWEDDFDEKLLLSKRGLSWLGINENIKSIHDIDEITFLNKMVDLGKLLSEDNMISSSQESLDLSPNEAKKLRLQLASQKDLMEALNNKGHIRHKEVIAYINDLNKIIARDKK